MQKQVMYSCFTGCMGRQGVEANPYELSQQPDRQAKLWEKQQAKRARLRDKQLSQLLHRHHKEEMRKLKLLLLGTGESGKSTMTKQMKIIHINGFTHSERQAKVADIVQNIRESIVAVVVAMGQLQIGAVSEDGRQSCDYVRSLAAAHRFSVSEEFWDHVTRLWEDEGVQECHRRCDEYQLMDSAKYFLDKVPEIRQPGYIPSDQDILRCRALTSSIQHIEFDVADTAGHSVKFSVYDVGGQRGERKKWIQVFDQVVAILYLADCSGYDQTLREDPDKNRLLEALQIFQQVWNNRFLRRVSVLLFLNKIDVMAQKVSRGRGIHPCLLTHHPGTFPDYLSYRPSREEQAEFMDAFPGGSDAPRRRGRSSSRTDIDPEVTKTACYIKHLFMQIVEGKLCLREPLTPHPPHWHLLHSCTHFYTCAVDTSNISKVLDGCRSLIIRKHLERFGII
ncbi:hypothetical protein ACOMHN_023883 [Nucella lapillus]